MAGARPAPTAQQEPTAVAEATLTAWRVPRARIRQWRARQAAPTVLPERLLTTGVRPVRNASLEPTTLWQGAHARRVLRAKYRQPLGQRVALLVQVERSLIKGRQYAPPAARGRTVPSPGAARNVQLARFLPI